MSVKISREVSRRDFLKAAAGAGILAAGSTMLPLSGYAAEKEKTEAASRFTVEQLELIGQPHPYTAVSYEPIEGTDPIEPLAVPDQWDYECDVVVVGCGGGGLVAATMCAEAGLSVIAVDKLEEAGGCTKESSVFVCYGGSRMQNEVEFAAPVFPYNPEALVQMWLASDPTLDIPLARKYAVNTPKTINWMQDHGVQWAFQEGGYAGFMWKDSVQGNFFPRAMKLTTDHMYGVAVKTGAEFFFKTQVVALIKNGDAIVGIKTVNTDGLEYCIHAKAGVILTSGGMEANPQMLQKYCPTIYAGTASCYNLPCNTGEVIRMGLGVGAELIGFDYASGFDGGIDAYAEGLGPFFHYLYSGDNQLSRQPWLTIDKTGARQIYLPFYPDGYHTGGIYDLFGGDTLAKVQRSRPGGRAYVIFDADYENYIYSFNQQGCRTPIRPDMPNVERMPEWLAPHDWRNGANKSIEKGIIKKADTIEELADKLSLNRDIVVGAVKNWNEVCEAGEDPEFGYQPNWLVPIMKPPFYGIRIGMQVSKTHCGLHVNPNFQVMNTHGLPIKGLYAGSHTNGGTINYGTGNAGSWTGGYCCAESLLKSVQGSV